MSLLGPREIRRLAADLGLKPTRSLGQNFVHDANTVRRIVAGAGLPPQAEVLEVGPGLGSLTLGLLEAGHRVTAIELDPRLALRLPATVAEHAPDRVGELLVVTGDALRVPIAGRPQALVANLPYNVAVPVLLRLLADVATLETALVMVQAEVAARLTAGPGSRTYGVPSVKVAWWGAADPAGAISRGVFWPEPRVDSALVRVTRRPPPVEAGVHPDPEAVRRRTFAAVDAAFAQRRKTLRTALAGWAGGVTAAEAALTAAGVDAGLRGEQLSVADFARIAAH